MQTLILHWDGSSWNTVPSPNASSYDNKLLAVTTVSANDIWAVGEYIDTSDGNYFYSHTLVEHYDGSSWSVVSSPTTSGYSLTGITAVSATDIWAVGATDSIVPLTLTMHYDGTSWSVVSSPNVCTSNVCVNSLLGVSAVSSNDVWAVGTYHTWYTGTYTSMTMHWDGSNWTMVSSPNVPNYQATYILGVKAIASNDVWAVGYSQDNSIGVQAQTMHWDGNGWNIVSTPTNTSSILWGVAAVNASDVWAVGSGSSGTLTEHYGPSPTPQHQKLFVLLQGINTALSQKDVDMNGGLGKIPDFEDTKNNVMGIVPFLKSHGFGDAQFLAYSYFGSDPNNGHPFSYKCIDTFQSYINQDVLNLSHQIGNFLKTQPTGTTTDIYFIGHSLGGVVAFAYLTALLEAPQTISPLPANARLKGLITLDSPLGGISSDKAFLNRVFDIMRSKPYSVKYFKGCDLLTDKGQMQSVMDLADLFNTTSKPTFPPTDDSNPGSQGAHASMLKAIFKDQALTNQVLAEMAASRGIPVLTIGNIIDFLYDPGSCLPGFPNFQTAQWVGDEGFEDSVKENQPPLTVYGREFLGGNDVFCFNKANVEDPINHKAVYNNSDVESGLIQFLNGGTPVALTVAPPEP